MESSVISYCAPTLAGLKAGSIFNGDIEDIRSNMVSFNDRYNKMGIYATVLLKRKSTALVYVYRRSRLERELCEPECAAFMKELGYTTDCNMCIEHLKRRISVPGEFPHEIGLFLSYPIEDVIGFIKNKGRNALMCGQWKVYGSMEKAQERFRIYRKCTCVYSRLFNEGREFEKLVVKG